MGADRCPDDLLARSRRGPLSAVEQRALHAHLGVCGLCRAALAFGALYDEIPDGGGPEDEAVVARLAARVVHGGSRSRGQARPVAFAVAAALLIAAGGAAAWVTVRRAPPTVVGGARPMISAQAPPAVARSIAAAPAPARPSPPAPESTTAPHRRLPVSRAVASGSPPRSVASEHGTTDSPAKLFAAANAARRAGDLREAISGYETVGRRYPGSAEAAVSLVSAGDLLARLGQPVAALERFDRYIGQHGAEPLAPEALFGRARCLQALARPDDEREAWRELLHRFPGSVYESAGRRRVDELGR